MAQPNNWVWTVDDFDPRPQSLRDIGVRSSYADRLHAGVSWSGVAPFENESSQKIFQEFKSIIGPEVVGDGFGFYRINRAKDLPVTYIHNDASISRFSGILYLNDDSSSPNLGGTAFWKHRRTGMVTHPSAKHLEAFGMENAQEFIDDGRDESKWDRIRLVENRFNRLLLFRSELWHSRYPYFGWGDNSSNARMVLVFFFN